MSTTVKRPEVLRPEGTEQTRTGITGFIRRNPVPIFYALAFGISWGGIVLILGPNGLFSTGTTMPFSGGAAHRRRPVHRRSPVDGSGRWKVRLSPAAISTASMAGRRTLVRGGAFDRPARDGWDSLRFVLGGPNSALTSSQLMTS